MTVTERSHRLGAALSLVRARIDLACRAAGRGTDEVSLLPVTKGFPAIDVALLVDHGIPAVGENRVQEAAAKVADVAALRPGAVLDWHLVGRLQRNKVRAAVAWAARIESVDSVPLADAVDAAARRAVADGRRAGPLPVLVQLSVDADPRRGGVPLDELSALSGHVAGCAGLALHGLMAVAPFGADADRSFGAVADAAARLRRDHPSARVISAGMSADLEVAIRHGSTCVRVGTALLGLRPLASGQEVRDHRGPGG